MRIIIIGGSGLIGYELYQEASRSNIKAIGTYDTFKREGLINFNMKNETLKSVIPDLKSSDIIYLLAAYSNPSWIYNNIKTARELNITATKKIIDEVSNVGCRIIFMSSVEVFDGKKGDYKENSKPNPLNTYGVMKYEIEKYLEKNYKNSCIVRTSWNVGWNLKHRCVINLTYETLLKPNAFMANDNTFSIADVKDTSQGLLKLSNFKDINKCHLASGQKLLVRSELAELVKNTSKYGKLMNYELTSFSKIPYSEPRALHNSLNTNFATNELKINFREPNDIIKQKVKFLDKRFNELNLH
tara:strand:+ start:626 stop:1525 length:900 start_codon:yes stop_codon:yes gene_type:complete